MGTGYDSNGLLKVLNDIVDGIPRKWVDLIRSYAADSGSVPANLHFFMPGNDEEECDIGTSTTRFFNHLFRKIDDSAVVPAGLVFWRDQFGDRNLKIPYDICYGGLKENFMGEIDYFLVHNSLYTNNKLCRVGLADDESCSLCNNDIESPCHLFVNCAEVQDLLLLTRGICQTIANKLITFEDFIKNVIFGYAVGKFTAKSKLINFVLNMYRFTIWSVRRWKKDGGQVSMRHVFKSFISTRMKWEFKRSAWGDSITHFFGTFGIGGAIVRPSGDSYALSFV
jgi:hypothetical protein